MADDDSLADRTTLMPLPGPATSLATLNAATLAPGVSPAVDGTPS
jgi:hypothetical protein